MSIPEEERDPIILAVFDVFLMEGQGEVKMVTYNFHNVHRRNRNTHDVLHITQEFSPIVLTKRETAKTHIKIDDDIDRILH